MQQRGALPASASVRVQPLNASQSPARLRLRPYRGSASLGGIVYWLAVLIPKNLTQLVEVFGSRNSKRATVLFTTVLLRVHKLFSSYRHIRSKR